MILIIDNYDSFVHNIARYLVELGETVRVRRNDEIEPEDLRVKALVISPGPCTPNEAGVSIEVIREYSGQLPILGICLGHQAIGQVFGGKVVRAKQPMHGDYSAINHDGSGVFEGLPQGFNVGRYHSLIVEDVDHFGEQADCAFGSPSDAVKVGHDLKEMYLRRLVGGRQRGCSLERLLRLFIATGNSERIPDPEDTL